MRRVGERSSMTRKKAGGLMLEEATARLANSLSRPRRVVLPQRFSGDSMPRKVGTSRKWKAKVWRIHKARVSAAHLGKTTKRRRIWTSALSKMLPGTGEGQGGTIGKWSNGVMKLWSGGLFASLGPAPPFTSFCAHRACQALVRLVGAQQCPL